MSLDLDPDSLSVGDELSPFRVDNLNRTQIVRYLGASGDFNPLHHNVEFARTGGYDDVIAPGMLVAGIASVAVTDWVPVDAINRFKTRFVGTVYPGDSLCVTGTVVEVNRTGNGTMADIELTVETDDGMTVLTGEAEIWL